MNNRNAFGVTSSALPSVLRNAGKLAFPSLSGQHLSVFILPYVPTFKNFLEFVGAYRKVAGTNLVFIYAWLAAGYASEELCILV